MLSLTLGSRSESCCCSGMTMKLRLRALNGCRMGHHLGWGQLGTPHGHGASRLSHLCMAPMGHRGDTRRTAGPAQLQVRGWKDGRQQDRVVALTGSCKGAGLGPTLGHGTGGLALKGVGMQRNCHGVIPLLHAFITELCR